MIVDIPQIKSRGASFSLVAQDIVETLSTGGEVVAPQGVQLWHYSFPLVAQTYEEAQEWMGALVDHWNQFQRPAIVRRCEPDRIQHRRYQSSSPRDVFTAWRLSGAY